MKHALLMMLVFSAGCSQFSQVQIDLLTQSRRGIENAKASLDDRSRLISAYHTLQRKRLDDAFDADVSERSDLSADWIIEHRKAYAAAVDAVASARVQSVQSDLSARQNLDAVDQALQRVIWLQSAQLRLTSIPEPKEIKP